MPATTIALERVYNRVAHCHVCAAMDRVKALRRMSAVNPAADVFVLSQALAEKQLRQSGVSFFTAAGAMGNTGRNLEKFLNNFNRTVYPPRPVRLAPGVTIPRGRKGYVSVYASEIAHCYPGKADRTGADRSPSSQEIRTCVEHGFLKEELTVVRPRVVLLMGDKARRAFYRHVLEERLETTLSRHLEQIIQSGRVRSLSFAHVRATVLPIQHASGANPAFWRMLKNDELIALIRSMLES